VSGTLVSPEPLPVVDDFDREWNAAREGSLASPSDASSDRSEPTQPAASGNAQAQVAEQVQPVAPVAPAQFQLPSEYQERLQAVGAKNLDEALALAREAHSIRGNLPQVQEQWKQKYVAPLETELKRLREERQQAVDDFVRFDPATGRARTREEAEQVRAQLEADERQQQETQQKSQREQQLDQREQAVQTVEQNYVRHGLRTSLELYQAQLAKKHGVSVEALNNYTKNTRYFERLAALPTLNEQMVEQFIIELADAAPDLAKQETERKAAANAPKYRDVGVGAGAAGGQQTGDRWNSVTEQQFDQAWEASKDGRLT
jgi:hypothetical protein